MPWNLIKTSLKHSGTSDKFPDAYLPHKTPGKHLKPPVNHWDRMKPTKMH